MASEVVFGIGGCGGCGSRMEAAPIGGDVGNVAMKQLFEGRRLKRGDDGAAWLENPLEFRWNSAESWILDFFLSQFFRFRFRF